MFHFFQPKSATILAFASFVIAITKYFYKLKFTLTGKIHQ